MKMGCLIALFVAVIFLVYAAEESVMIKKIVKPDAEWKKQLTCEQYRVIRKKGTERPYSGEYWDHKERGVYACIGCGADLFLSNAKFDSGCGWPSYFKPVNKRAITEHQDTTLGILRTEVVCSKCDAHLGHVFSDGPPPTGLRYCINSVSINFRKEPSPAAEKNMLKKKR